MAANEEIEIKFRIDDLHQLIQALRRSGFRLVTKSSTLATGYGCIAVLTQCHSCEFLEIEFFNTHACLHQPSSSSLLRNQFLLNVDCFVFAR
jgi:hypothetical protein